MDTVQERVRGWCVSTREQLKEMLIPLETGAMRVGNNRGFGWEDRTLEQIATLQRQIAELTDLIGRLEA